MNFPFKRILILLPLVAQVAAAGLTRPTPLDVVPPDLEFTTDAADASGDQPLLVTFHAAPQLPLLLICFNPTNDRPTLPLPMTAVMAGHTRSPPIHAFTA